MMIDAGASLFLSKLFQIDKPWVWKYKKKQEGNYRARRKALSSCYQPTCPTALNIILDILIVHSDRGVRDKLSHFPSRLMCFILPPLTYFFHPPPDRERKTHSRQVRVGNSLFFNSSKQPFSPALNVTPCVWAKLAAGVISGVSTRQLRREKRSHWSCLERHGGRIHREQKGQERD